MEAGLQENLIQNQRNFYCPLGHVQHYIGKTNAEKAREERDQARRELERAQAAIADWRDTYSREKASHSATKGQLTKVKKRIEKGVCPECNRHFVNVERHMATQHGEPDARKAAAAREKAQREATP